MDEMTKVELHGILMAYEMMIEKENDTRKEFVFKDTKKNKNVASKNRRIHLTYQMKKKQIL